MNINIGNVDRVLRILVGLALIGWSAFFQGPSWAYVGILPLLTGLVRWCPAYAVFGIATSKGK